jgi:hypothetical protein
MERKPGGSGVLASTKFEFDLMSRNPIDRWAPKRLPAGGGQPSIKLFMSVPLASVRRIFWKDYSRASTLN